MNEPTTLPEILAHFRTAYAPKHHHPELTPVQQVRINQIDAYRAQRYPSLKQNGSEQVWRIMVCGWMAVAAIALAIGLAISMDFQGFGDTQEQLRVYRAIRHEAVAVEVAKR